MVDRMTLAKQYARCLIVMLRQKGVRGGQMAKLRGGARYLVVPVRLNQPLDLGKATSLAQELTHAASVRQVMIIQREGWITYQFELPPALWETYTRKDLKDRRGTAAIGVGLQEGNQQVDVDFSRSPHIYILGGSRVSGKSTCLNSLLTGMMVTHTARELQVLMIDPAGDCSHGLLTSEHLAMPVAETKEQAALVIDRAIAEKKKREEMRYRAGGGLPMFLLAIDEAQNIVPESGRQRELAQLGEQVAKLDMHLAIATQKPMEDTLPGLGFNLGTRLVGQVPTSRDAAMLTGRRSAEAPAHQLTDRGDLLLIAGGQDVTRVQAAIATDEDRAQITTNGNLRWPGLSEKQDPEVRKTFEPESVDAGGRPRIEVMPRVVARYMWAAAKGLPITEPQARKAFQVARTGHERNRDFAAAVSAELRRLTGNERTTAH